MKKRFLLLGSIAVLALTSCDSKDTKEIQNNIEGKTQEEIVQMVADANANSSLEDELNEGCKLSGNATIKGNVSENNVLGVSGNVSLTADLSAIYNTDGSQTSLNANVSIKDSDSKESFVKANMVIESLNSEADIYTYANMETKLNGTESNQTTKTKAKKTEVDESALDEILNSMDINLDDVDISKLKELLSDCEVSVDDGLLLFTKSFDNETEAADYFKAEGLTGKLVVGFDKDYHLRKFECNVSAKNLSVSESGVEVVSLSDLVLSFSANLEAGSFKIKSLEDKGSYTYSLGSLF